MSPKQGFHGRPIAPRLLALAFAFVALQPALADIEECGSREFRREFLVGSPMEPAEGARCGMTSPSPRLVKAGDRVLPCLAGIVEGTGAKFLECRKEPRLCQNWAMGAIAASGTPRAVAFLMFLAGSTADADQLIGAAGSLANMHVRQAIPILRARLDSGDDRVRADLVMSLGILQARDYTPELVTTTLGLKPEDFYRAIHGFRFLGDPSVVPALRKYVDAMPASDMRNLLMGQVNDIGVVANFQAGIEQKNGGFRPWSESFLRAAIDEGVRAGSSAPIVGEAYYELGDMCRRDGRLDEAGTLFARAEEVWRKSLPLGDGKHVDLEIVRALVRDAGGTDPALADKFAYFARLLHAARPERRNEIESRFPELRETFERYTVYCRTNKLVACQQDLDRLLSDPKSGATDLPSVKSGGHAR
ncbi:MAG: hypothetical protein LAO51_10640 [Acidobacteriia bacterium]|nr:hypothetical protein [Terriglobia bacterium]